MSETTRRWLLWSGPAAGGLLLVVGGLYWASTRVPSFYESAMSYDAQQVRKASDDLLRQTAALASDIRRQTTWKALFTEEQINGWLAVDATENHSQLFPPTIREPRVAIDDDIVRVGFHWQDGLWSTVVSIEAQIYLRETNVVAVRLRSSRAGLLPLPVGRFLEQFAASAENFGLHVEQQQIDDDPLLLVTLPPYSVHRRSLPSLESLELHKGEIYLAGTVGKPSPAGARSLASRIHRLRDAQSGKAPSGEKQNFQR